MSFLNYKDHIEDGDTIIAFMVNLIYCIILYINHTIFFQFYCFRVVQKSDRLNLLRLHRNSVSVRVRIRFRLQD